MDRIKQTLYRWGFHGWIDYMAVLFVPFIIFLIIGSFWSMSQEMSLRDKYADHCLARCEKAGYVTGRPSGSGLGDDFDDIEHCLCQDKYREVFFVPPGALKE